MSTACGTQSPGCPPPACPQKPRLGDGAPPAHLVGVLQVEPGVEGARGQVQVGELELGHAGADAPLVLVDAEDGEAQAVLLQRRRIQRHREALVEGHGVGAPLDLPREAGIALAPTGRGAASLRCPVPREVRRHPQGTPHPIGMICSRPDHGSCSATGVKIRAVACPSAHRYIPPPRSTDARLAWPYPVAGFMDTRCNPQPFSRQNQLLNVPSGNGAVWLTLSLCHGIPWEQRQQQLPRLILRVLIPKNWQRETALKSRI